MNPSLLTAGYERVVRPVLFRAYGGDPEKIHEKMIAVLGGLAGTPAASVMGLFVGRPKAPVTVAGVKFPGRVGLAAGIDKDGVAARIWAKMGFGFAELGTVTAQAQPGNPRPRIFRLPRSQGLINRMGFNNEGAVALARRLESWGVARGEDTLGIPLGISIGKTKIVDLDEAVEDYCQSFVAVQPYADYVAVNVSSPNTPGLRALQGKSQIHDLVGALVDQSRSSCVLPSSCRRQDPSDHSPLSGMPLSSVYSSSSAHSLSSCRRQDPVGSPATQVSTPTPIFVKLAPDLDDADLDALLESSIQAGASGLIATNTTLARDGIRDRDLRYARQPGGLSGAPLTLAARRVVARATSSGLPVIASGGIMSVADAQAMFDLGAVAVQVCTGFIYHGPGLVAGINTRCTPVPVVPPSVPVVVPSVPVVLPSVPVVPSSAPVVVPSVPVILPQAGSPPADHNDAAHDDTDPVSETPPQEGP